MSKNIKSLTFMLNYLGKKLKKYLMINYNYKNKIRRTYRIDRMNKKLNLSIYNFLRENREEMNLSDELINYFKKSSSDFKSTMNFDLMKRFPNFKIIFDEYLKSEKFKKMIIVLKNKQDEEFLKLFFRHTKNFMNLHSNSFMPFKTLRRLRMRRIHNGDC